MRITNSICNSYCTLISREPQFIFAQTDKLLVINCYHKIRDIIYLIVERLKIQLKNTTVLEVWIFFLLKCIF